MFQRRIVDTALGRSATIEAARHDANRSFTKKHGHRAPQHPPVPTCLALSRILLRSSSVMNSPSQKSLCCCSFDNRASYMQAASVLSHVSCDTSCTKRATSRSKLSLESENFSKDRRMVSCKSSVARRDCSHYSCHSHLAAAASVTAESCQLCCSKCVALLAAGFISATVAGTATGASSTSLACSKVNMRGRISIRNLANAL